MERISAPRFFGDAQLGFGYKVFNKNCPNFSPNLYPLFVLIWHNLKVVLPPLNFSEILAQSKNQR